MCWVVGGDIIFNPSLQLTHLNVDPQQSRGLVAFLVFKLRHTYICHIDAKTVSNEQSMTYGYI